MSVDERIEALKAQHARLEHQIDEEIHRPHPDDLHLVELKREKLKVKDEMSKITH
jgi:hypothetical protein